MFLQVSEEMSRTLSEAASALLTEVKRSRLSDLKLVKAPCLARTSVFDEVPSDLKADVLRLADAAVAAGNLGISRAMGAISGMAVADSLGHNFEFVAVRDAVGDSPSFFEYPCADQPGGKFHEPYNKFRLAPGQWYSLSTTSFAPSDFWGSDLVCLVCRTDDTSMGLCLADSILLAGEYEGSRTRIWFANWSVLAGAPSRL
jgi:hypothetical protein